MAKRKSTRQKPKVSRRVKTTKKSTKPSISRSLSNRIEKALLYLTNPRMREVIGRRFGLKNGQFETLESIGRSHGITRERVRQIQDAGLNILKSDEVFPLFGPIFEFLDDLFIEHGQIMGEEYLYYTATNTKQPHPLRGQLYLVLTLGEPYQKIINDNRFHPYWTTDLSARSKAEKLVDFLISHFSKYNQVHLESEIFDLFSKKYSNLPPKLFFVVLDIAKEINKNSFGEVGLVHWPEITPQGVKDRAYLVLKKTGQPLHFTEITNLINKMGLSPREAYSQTVHNEVIKDPRFVLVGRGTYALAEWGYQSGTVEEVIENILKETKEAMTKEEILERVLTQRKVKPTTIVLNLQRSPKFEKLADGRFTLAP